MMERLSVIIPIIGSTHALELRMEEGVWSAHLRMGGHTSNMGELYTPNLEDAVRVLAVALGVCQQSASKHEQV